MLRNYAARYTFGFLTENEHRIIGIVRLVKATAAEFLEQEHGPEALAVMRGLKHSLDPRGIMNPGKMFRN